MASRLGTGRTEENKNEAMRMLEFGRIKKNVEDGIWGKNRKLL